MRKFTAILYENKSSTEPGYQELIPKELDILASWYIDHTSLGRGILVILKDEDV